MFGASIDGASVSAQDFEPHTSPVDDASGSAHRKNEVERCRQMRLALPKRDLLGEQS